MNAETNPRLIYNLPEQEPTRELKPSQYFLVISASGDVLKTKYKPEFKIVKEWKGVVFADIVSNGQTLFYLIGSTEYSEKIKSLKVSDAFSKDGCFHFTDLQHMGHTIKKCWIEQTIPKRLSL